MSSKIKVLTEMRNIDVIVEALQLMGIPDDMIVRQPDGVEIRGYRGARWGRAEVLVRREFHRGYGDAGFVREGDAYAIALDHIDDRRIPQQLGRQGTFTQLASQWYSAAMAKRTLRDKGYSASIRQEGERVRVSAYR